MPILGAECSLPLVSFLNTDPVVGILNIEFGEVFCSLNPIKNLQYQEERVAILLRNPIESSIVDA